MPSSPDGVFYAMVISMLVVGVLSGLFMVVAPKAFIDTQRRLHAMVGFPTERLEPIWQRMPVRLLGALYLPFCIAALYFLLVVNPDFIKESLFVRFGP